MGSTAGMAWLAWSADVKGAATTVGCRAWDSGVQGVGLWGACLGVAGRAVLHVQLVRLLRLVKHELLVRWYGHQLLVSPLTDIAVARRAELVRRLDLRAKAHGAVEAVLRVHLEPQRKLPAPLLLLVFLRLLVLVVLVGSLIFCRHCPD